LIFFKFNHIFIDKENINIVILLLALKVK